MTPVVEVLAQAVSRRFVEPSYVRLHLGLTVSDITDTKLDDMIEEACAFVESWCDRSGEMFAERVSERQWLFSAARSLYLTRRPVVTIESITEGTSALTAADWAIDYDAGRLDRLDGSSGLSTWGYPTIAGTGGLLVTTVYRAGYYADDDTGGNVPADLRAGTLELVRDRWNAAQRDSYVRSEEVPGAYSVSYGFGTVSTTGSAMPPSAEMYLNKYRKRLSFA